MSALVLAVVFSLRLDSLKTELKNQRFGNCSTLFAQASAPYAPGAPRDIGTRSVAAAARIAYEEHECVKHGFVPLPPAQPFR